MLLRTAVTAFTLVTILAGAIRAGAEGPSPGPAKTVLFVCEHGAARSVIAAAHFNREAEARHLPYRAIARGSVAQEQPSAATVKGLQVEGLTARPAKPEQLTAADVESAARVVTLGCDISKITPAKADRWDDVPAPSDDYAAARRVIDGHVAALLAELEAPRP